MIKLVIIFICLQVFSGFVFAGGPLVIEGPMGNTAVRYQNPVIIVHVESGDLGERSNAAADGILRKALQQWNQVGTSTVRLIVNETQLNQDINIGNFSDFIAENNSHDLKGDDGFNPIIYDDSGEIVDAFFGVNASDNIIGFAASIFNEKGAFFKEGYVVINGKTLSPALSDTELTLLVAHEIGHFAGLDHTQVDINNRETDLGFPGICSTAHAESYPVMYPFVCRDEASLHVDDISAISALYPDENILDSFGILQGHFVDESGKAILGANIWAKNTITGEAISIVSDYLKQGNGFYKLYLPPGNYTLHANSINPLFNAGSSIGPYSLHENDKSFVSPHPITEVAYQGVTQGNAVNITIDPGQTLDITFSVTGSDAVLVSEEKSSGNVSYITLLMLLSFLLLLRAYVVNRSLTNLRKSSWCKGGLTK